MGDCAAKARGVGRRERAWGEAGDDAHTRLVAFYTFSEPLSETMIRDRESRCALVSGCKQ